MRFSLRPLLVVLGIILGLLGTLSAGHIAHAQFDPLGAGVGGVAGGDAEWADVDDDGDLDLLLIGNGSGSTDNAQPSATLYENQGDGTFSPFNAGLEGVSAGSAAFGDFNDDGHPDLIITGNQGGFSEENPPVNSAQIYENDGSGDFSHLNAGIEGVTVGCVDWADVDTDGNLDLVVAGNIGGFGILPPPLGEEPDPSVLIYEGDGNGSFEQVDAGIDEGVAAVCSSNFGDIDDDGDADLAITGGQGNLDNPEPYAAVYENDGTGTFSPVNAPITDVAGRAATWADVDDNASLDLILAGVEADSVQRTRLYLNDGNGGFSESSTSLADVAGGAIAPADVDLDGDLDLALSGRDTTGSPVAFVYENDGTGEFTPFEAGLTPVEGSAAAWGDVGVETSPDLALVGRDADSTATATIYENQLGGTAQAQFIHNAADPAADSVDVYFGNERALDDVGFRSATEFIDVPAGLDIEAGVAPAGSSGPEDIVATQPVTFGAGEAHTVVANGVLTPDEFADNPDGAPIGVEFFVESGAKTTASSGEVDLRAVHGATDAPTVDIGAVETPLFEGLTYGDVTSNYTTATAEEKLLTVTASGPDTLVAAFQADLSGLDGDAATMLASGFLDPAANQNGSAFRLIAAQPNGTVTTFPLNEAPQFTSVPADFAVAPETEIDTTIEANDPDGDELTFSATDGLPDGASIDASTGQFAWTPSLDQQDSTYTIGVQAGDGAVETDTSFAVTVEPGNIPPMVVAGPPDDSIEVTGPPLQLVNLGSAFQDPDGDSLSITATSGDPSIVSVNGSGRQIPLVPTNTGTADVTLTADDGSATASTGFSVTVLPDDGNENPSSQSLAVVDSAGSGTVDLGDTDVAIDFSDISGSGSVAASRFDSGPDGTDGIDESNVSDYRLLISAAGGLGPGSNTEVRFPVSDFGGISDPTMVIAYSRSTPGQGTFADLPTSVDESGTPGDPSDDVIVATTGSFSEFVLASDTEPLPVELANFEAVRSGSSVELRWQTASETNNIGFRIQHEAAQGWQELGRVDSKADGGTTTEGQSYRFAVERELEPGTHRFRLEQVDLDGTTSLSDVVSVEVQMDEALTLSPPAPNPTSGPATVSFAVKEATDAEVVVYNVLGQRVKTLYEGTPRAGQSKRLTIDAGSLPSGVYMVQLRADGQTKTRRLTVVQ